MIDYAALDGLAAQWMRDRKAHLTREKGFIYKHGKRVSVSVLELRRRVTDDDSHDDALRIAAMFHDIGKGIEPHNITAGVLIRTLLGEHLPGELLEEVAWLAENHVRREITHLFANLLQDADTLDHFGTIDILMTAQYGAYTEGGVETMLDWYREGFEELNSECRATLHFDVSRAVFDEKQHYSREFARRLAIEAEGRYASCKNERGGVIDGRQAFQARQDKLLS